jgi:hypothetical protein
MVSERVCMVYSPVYFVKLIQVFTLDMSNYVYCTIKMQMRRVGESSPTVHAHGNRL